MASGLVTGILRNCKGPTFMKTTKKKTAMKTAKPQRRTEKPASTSDQLAGFIAKFDPTMAKLIRSVRAALRKRFPTANELVYDNYNFFVIGYCTTERSSDCLVSLAAQAKGVALSFYYGSTIRISFCRGAATRTGSFDWKAQRHSRTRKSKRFYRQRRPRPGPHCCRQEKATRLSNRFRPSSVRDEAVQVNDESSSIRGEA